MCSAPGCLNPEFRVCKLPRTTKSIRLARLSALQNCTKERQKQLESVEQETERSMTLPKVCIGPKMAVRLHNVHCFPLFFPSTLPLPLSFPQSFVQGCHSSDTCVYPHFHEGLSTVDDFLCPCSCPFEENPLPYCQDHSRSASCLQTLPICV